MSKSDFLKTWLKQDINNQCASCWREECIEYFTIPLIGSYSSDEHILDNCIGVIIQYCKNTQTASQGNLVNRDSTQPGHGLNASVLNVDFLQYNIVHTSIESVRVDCKCSILKAYCGSAKHLVEYKGRIVSVGQDV